MALEVSMRSWQMYMQVDDAHPERKKVNSGESFVLDLRLAHQLPFTLTSTQAPAACSVLLSAFWAVYYGE